MKPSLESLIAAIGEIAPLHKEWAYRNFGDSKDPSRACLGIVEELGELVHARLKSLQGIRGTQEQHFAAMADAIGDSLLYTMDALTRFYGGDVAAWQAPLANNVSELASDPSYQHVVAVVSVTETASNAMLLAWVEGAVQSASRIAWKQTDVLHFEASGSMLLKVARYAARIVIHIDAIAAMIVADPASCLETAWNEIRQRDWVNNAGNGSVEGGAK